MLTKDNSDVERIVLEDTATERSEYQAIVLVFAKYVQHTLDPFLHSFARDRRLLDDAGVRRGGGDHADVVGCGEQLPVIILERHSAVGELWVCVRGVL